MKQTPLRRVTPLKATTPLAPGGAVKRKTALAPVSKARQRVNRERAQVLVEHFGPRSSWRCAMKDAPVALAVFGPCLGAVNGHEVLSRAAAGGRDDNLLDVQGIILLCAQHNGAVEDHPRAAYELGYKRHGWEGRT